MTKQEIVNTVSEATGLTKVETEAVMNGVMSTIIESLGKNKRVELRGFGRFSIKIQKSSIRRNPKTGEKVNTPEKKTIHFKMSKDLFKKINNEAKNKFLKPNLSESLPVKGIIAVYPIK